MGTLSKHIAVGTCRAEHHFVGVFPSTVALHGTLYQHWLSWVALFCVGEDNVIAKYDKHKADQTGEKVHEKHLFDNPFDPLVSLFLALGVYLSLKSM